ncbi:MAG: 4Fe-4S dicluster domain-containing protein [Planctomycetes bacterium]|nr:4Fe-4S dicluster domain-containing protein [Planctomycetota bacterium]
MQLGFVIDHSRCIGCHACTVACKSENAVPVGSFRTWVKYTETGEFPQVKRHFAVLRCNQCTNAPCVTICPTQALTKHANGIVDVDPKFCIGCKSCMQGCPYDALYIHPEHGTAQKCHFCEHRTERGLAPACAVVCPTEAIIPGDFDDPKSMVARLRAMGELEARKTEAGTQPNVWYREVDPSAIQPTETSPAGGYLWSNQIEGPQHEASRFLATLDERAQARTTYDIDQQPMWGWKVSLYLLTKAIAGGLALAGMPVLTAGEPRAVLALALLALVFLLVTTALLVVDLKRPERFLLILTHPNWDSWLVKGAWILIGYSALVSAWLGMAWFETFPAGLWRSGLAALTALFGVLTAGYTAFLFAQAKGRPLWMMRGMFSHLVLQSLIAGSACVLLVARVPGLAEGMRAEHVGIAFLALAGALLACLMQAVTKRMRAPVGREREYGQALDLIERGPYARRHKLGGLGLGLLLPLTLLVLVYTADSTGPVAEWSAWLQSAAALAALVGLYVEKDVLVRAGQALPIS